MGKPNDEKHAKKIPTGIGYTDAELEANPDLKARLKAEYRDAWDKASTGRRVPRDDNTHSSRRQLVEHSVD